MTAYSALPIAGWNETASLPELGVNSIRVKLDTGAKTSALHAFNIVEVVREDKTWVEFEVHPFQNNDRDVANSVCEWAVALQHNGRKHSVQSIIINGGTCQIPGWRRS